MNFKLITSIQLNVFLMILTLCSWSDFICSVTLIFRSFKLFNCKALNNSYPWMNCQQGHCYYHLLRNILVPDDTKVCKLRCAFHQVKWKRRAWKVSLNYIWHHSRVYEKINKFRYRFTPGNRNNFNSKIDVDLQKISKQSGIELKNTA